MPTESIFVVEIREAINRYVERCVKAGHSDMDIAYGIRKVMESMASEARFNEAEIAKGK